MPSGAPAPDEEHLLETLRQAVHASPARPQEIEVGIPLSIALGKRRPNVSCGGCQVPLEFDGIPARTVAGLPVPFRLVFSDPRGS